MRSTLNKNKISHSLQSSQGSHPWSERHTGHCRAQSVLYQDLHCNATMLAKRRHLIFHNVNFHNWSKKLVQIGMIIYRTYEPKTYNPYAWQTYSGLSNWKSSWYPHVIKLPRKTYKTTAHTIEVSRKMVASISSCLPHNDYYQLSFSRKKCRTQSKRYNPPTDGTKDLE